ncbi:MAG: helical backbone metal receptor [Ferrimicrobium sp.]
MRIISLVPSVTETLIAWGCVPVACTRFCKQPDLTHVGGTKDPDIGRIVDLKPDLVVFDAEENRREDHDALVARGIDTYVLRIRSLYEVDAAMTGLARQIGASWLGMHLPNQNEVLLKAFIPIWRHPWIALGTPSYGASLLAHLGIGTIFVDDGPYPRVSLDEAARGNPDIVVAPNEPYPFTARELPELSSVARTVFVDGQDLFWWGVRTQGAIQRLATVFAAL